MEISNHQKVTNCASLADGEKIILYKLGNWVKIE